MVSLGDQTFPSALRLRQSADFNRVRRGGLKFHTHHFVVLFLVKAEGPTRLGLTVSRKVGNAVHRNKVKRLVREFFRKNTYQLPPHTDFSIIAKVGAANLGYAGVSEELKSLCQLTSSDWAPQ